MYYFSSSSRRTRVNQVLYTSQVVHVLVWILSSMLPYWPNRWSWTWCIRQHRRAMQGPWVAWSVQTDGDLTTTNTCYTTTSEPGRGYAISLPQLHMMFGDGICQGCRLKGIQDYCVLETRSLAFRLPSVKPDVREERVASRGYEKIIQCSAVLKGIYCISRLLLALAMIWWWWRWPYWCCC